MYTGRVGIYILSLLIAVVVSNEITEIPVKQFKEKEKPDDSVATQPLPKLSLLGNVDGKTFFISSETYGQGTQTTWVDALTFCQRNGMSLVAIESEAQSNMIGSYLLREAQAGRGIRMNVIQLWGIYIDYYGWTSGTDYFTEGNWYWLRTGAAFNYTNWGNNQPVQSTWYNCMYLGPDPLGLWSSNYCDINYARAVCEIP